LGFSPSPVAALNRTNF